MKPVAVRSAAFATDDEQTVFWDRVEGGAWEPELLALLERLAGPGTLVLDIGAWVGPVSLYAAALGAAVVAVEADPAALVECRRNLAANPELAARIDLVPRAAAARPGRVRFGARRKPGDSMSSTLLASGDRESWDAEAVTVADLARRLPSGRPLLVKLDIEGGEYELLPALAPLLLARSADLLVSFHPDTLRDAGERDPEGRLRGALAPLAGWWAHPLAAGSAGVPGLVPAVLLADPAQESWWLRPHAPALGREARFL